ncbi:MAG TPA: hypothetical protein VGT60_03410 [Candidatus Limnocylindria bacterium]|nr:hypothetical protein [Candidatus Limnocylindria bacterium]
MADLVSFVCVRADHQWGTADAGRVHAKDGGLGWCPDASLDAHEHHEWRACEAAPLAAAAGLAAHLGTVESAVS